MRRIHILSSGRGKMAVVLAAVGIGVWLYGVFRLVITWDAGGLTTRDETITKIGLYFSLAALALGVSHHRKWPNGKTDKNIVTFVDDVLNGRAVVDDAQDYISQWHDGNSALRLHGYLGFLWPEYAVYAELEEAAEYIIRARRLGQDLRTYLSSRKDDGPEEAELWAEIEKYDQEWAAVYRGESGEPWRHTPVPVHPDTAKLITTIRSTRQSGE